MDGEAYKKKSLKVAWRNVWHFLLKNGYKHGCFTGNIVLSTSHQLLLELYLAKFFANRAFPTDKRLWEVYLDKLYIHKHYNRNDNSLWDPGNKQDLQYIKAKNKGRKYSFWAAIQEPNPSNVEQKPVEIIAESVWHFSP